MPEISTFETPDRPVIEFRKINNDILTTDSSHSSENKSQADLSEEKSQEELYEEAIHKFIFEDM